MSITFFASQIDLTGTGLQMKDTVSWIHQGFPKRQRIQDLNKTSDGLIAFAKCGGYCGRCKPKDGVITLEPMCLLPAGETIASKLAGLFYIISLLACLFLCFIYLFIHF